MQRRVSRRILDEYVSRNSPNGMAKLALASGVSVSALEKARIGQAPKKQGTRLRICEALGVQESVLFPVVAGKSRAS